MANGILDGYIDHGLDLWDYAAGWLIVEEAGGEVLRIRESENTIVLAGNSTLVHAIAQVLEFQEVGIGNRS